MADTATEERALSGKGIHWMCDPTQEIPIKLSDKGLGAVEPKTVIQVFENAVKQYPNKVAMNVKRNDVWKSWTWTQYKEEVLNTARSLLKLGLQRFQGVAIIGFNSPEWLFADLGTIFAGGIVAGIYTTNGPEACQYIVDHCEAAVIFVENEAQLKKFLQIRDQLPKLKAIVQWSGVVPQGEKDVYSWEQFIELGKDADEELLKKRMADQKPGHACTLIYTSGTTGPPKAVMVSHDNVTWTSGLVINSLNVNHNDVMVSFLPLSHIAAQMLDIHGPISVGANIYFAQPDALKGSLGQTLKEVRPTFFLGVPRVWEKIQEKMTEIGKQTTGFKKSIAMWAREKGLAGNYALQKGGVVPWGWFVANKVVFDKVKVALGLDRCRFCATAAAPIAKETLEYFLSLNIPIYEIYGMSECTGPQTVNRLGKHKTGTAGPSLDATELKIVDADANGDGEICYRGRHIFMGYMKNEKATAETIDEEGWLHSGDIGRLDADGFLYITGRIKELIITAGGENIPPVLIEDEIKKLLPDVLSNVMVIGDRKKYLTCFVTLKTQPNSETKEGEYPFSDTLVPGAVAEFEKAGSSAKTVQEAAADEKAKKCIENAIAAANKKATSRAQAVQKFKILPKDFTLEGNELTPTMKLKRRIVIEKYSKEIDELYADAE